MDPVSIGALLTAFTKAAGAEFGKEFAKQFVELVFGQLATKDDLRSAIEEIKRYIDQAIDRFEEDMVEAGIFAGVRHLKDFNNTRAIEHLHRANETVTNSIGLLQARSAHDPDVLRRYFVSVVKLLTTDIAVWAAYAAYTRDRGNKKNLEDHITQDCDLINNGIEQIERFERENVSDVQVESESLYESDGDRMVFSGLTFRAYIALSRKRYAGGRNDLWTGWYREGEDRARSEATAFRNRELARIKADAEFREKNVYEPARRFCEALTILKPRVAAYQQESE